jgi:predicted HicB family RNase H-like nuclease
MNIAEHQTIPDVSHYTYRVMWSADDEEFVATCVEFPSLSWLASTQSKALKGIDALVAEVVADLAASREEIPTPIADRRFSGKFNVRVGERLHRELTLQATEAGLSLNQYLVSRLSSTP